MMKNISFYTHSFISILLLLASIEKIKKNNKKSKFLYVITIIYFFMYLIEGCMKWSVLMENILFLVLYLLTIILCIYIAYVIFKQKV